LTRQWLRERKRDYYHRLAIEEGYRSRAAYKLLQIADRHHFIKEGDVVLDLGAAPGGWMQAVLTLVGDKGYILGVDLKPIESFKEVNVSSIVADIEKLSPSDLLRRLPRRPDVLLSDLSPNLSGVWNVDHARQMDLAKSSLRLANGILKLGGNMVVKVFQGEFFKTYLEEIREAFERIRVIKPKASRKESAEMYILGFGFRG